LWVDDGEMPPVAMRPSVERVTEAIRSGTCPDDLFDRFLPEDLRRVSRYHWTPLAVAGRVADWLDDVGVRSVVDIGAGPGKLCVAAALAGSCSYTGLEQRPRFVEAARRLARLFRVEDRARFIQGSLAADTIPEADAYYLYNPFGENLFGTHERLDDEVELSPERYHRDVALMEWVFARARTGTYVIDYNGFGGLLPATYVKVRFDPSLPSELRMWRKLGPSLR
jgi:SAM-dependent methyltransferase